MSGGLAEESGSEAEWYQWTQRAVSSRAWVISRLVTGLTSEASTVATAAVWPSSVVNSTSKALPSW